MKYLVTLYLKVPSTEEKWLSIAEKFECHWQYPNAIGAIDRKHVVIWIPSHGGLHYYNYKHSHSVILIAIANPSYECLYPDEETNGRVNDHGISYLVNKCGFSKALESQEFSMPNPRCLPGGVQRIPFVLIGDNTFTLKTNMMKPYPNQNLTNEKRVYNYRQQGNKNFRKHIRYTGKQKVYLSYGHVTWANSSWKCHFSNTALAQYVNDKFC